MSRSEGLRQLDQVVVSMELTLISIIQGVALSFLAVSTHAVLASGRYEFLAYSFAGLLLICTVWSRSILHVLTIVRWPLELVHGFLYIAIALGQSLTFSAIDSPVRWFTLSAVTALVVWLTYGFDLAVLDREVSEGRLGPALELYQAVRRDQVLNLKVVVPVSAALCGLAALLMWAAPTVFLARRWHLALAGAQAALFVSHLIATLALSRRLAPLIVRSQEP